MPSGRAFTAPTHGRVIGDRALNDIILYGGTVLTMDDALPVASALLVRDGRVIAVGGPEVLLHRQARTEMLDLEGKTVCPGFIDAHHHITLAAWYQQGIDLSACRSRDEIVAHITLYALDHEGSGWIYCYNYMPRWLRDGAITRHELDLAAPDRPVLVMHFSFHEGVVSTSGLRLAGIDRRTQDPQGGRIGRDRHGEPNGELVETAIGPVEALARSAAAGTGYESWLAALHRYSQNLVAAGITHVCDPGVDGMLEGYLRRAQRDGALPLPVSMLFVSERGLFQPPSDRLDGPVSGENLDGLAVDGVKFFADGGSRCGVCVGLREALGGVLRLVGRTVRLRRPALLLAAGSPDRARFHRHGRIDLGYLHYQPEELARLCAQAHSRGFQLAVHAACNAGLEVTLNALQGLPVGNYRHRVEHLVSLDRVQAHRLAGTGAIGVVQPAYVDLLGDEWEATPTPSRLHSVPLRDLQDAGVVLAGSSDAPIASYHPLRGMQSAITRRTRAGLLHQPEQALTPLEALRLWTTGAAQAVHRSGEIGVLRPGSRADLVVLGANPLHTPPHRIGGITIERTIIAGNTVYASAGGDATMTIPPVVGL